MQKTAIKKSELLFSIGVPTFNRLELLRHTIKSILAQTYPKFEILIGNDYTETEMTADLLGIHDSRIKIFNHDTNLGEIENMNALLKLAEGSYFTWQFDDDFYATNFLEEVRNQILIHSYPKLIQSSYKYYWGNSEPKFSSCNSKTTDSMLVNGSWFVNQIFSKNLSAMGACGVFEKDYLIGIGGAPVLTSQSVGLYSEHLLLLKNGLLENIVFMNLPYIFYRDHEDSWSGRNLEIDAYLNSGKELILEMLPIIKNRLYDEHRNSIIYYVIKLTLQNLILRIVTSRGKIDYGILNNYYDKLSDEISKYVPADISEQSLAIIEKLKKESQLEPIIKGYMKRLPKSLQKTMRSIRARLSL